MKKILFAISSAVLISSCGGGDTAAGEKTKQDSLPQTCTYSYDSSATTIGFGGFKFTEKKEVKGGFLKFAVEGTKEDTIAYNVVEGASFKIDIEGLNTKDQARDYNIKSSLFAKMDSTAFIIGTIKKLKYEVVSSIPQYKATIISAEVSIKMNGIEKDYNLQLSLSGEELTLTGAINLNDFKAQKALESLHETCLEYHRGSDGKSVTWPEVNIYVSTTLKKNCQ